MIDAYTFGKITVDGKTYTNDIRIINNKVKPNWWRKEGHRLYIEDIQDILEKKPNTIIVGCGHDGVMKVDQRVRNYCRDNNIQLIELHTGDAVKRFNETTEPGLVGIFHLTC